jgi:hypothetical protein
MTYRRSSNLFILNNLIGNSRLSRPQPHLDEQNSSENLTTGCKRRRKHPVRNRMMRVFFRRQNALIGEPSSAVG